MIRSCLCRWTKKRHTRNKTIAHKKNSTCGRALSYSLSNKSDKPALKPERVRGVVEGGPNSQGAHRSSYSVGRPARGASTGAGIGVSAGWAAGWRHRRTTLRTVDSLSPSWRPISLPPTPWPWSASTEALNPSLPIGDFLGEGEGMVGLQEEEQGGARDTTLPTLPFQNQFWGTRAKTSWTDVRENLLDRPLRPI